MNHSYTTTIKWTGNLGSGTGSYAGYSRNHSISVKNKPEIPASSDPSFRGDDTRYNPEELLLASLSSCHMLWYLHLCADNKIVVTSYSDTASGKMEENDSGGKFTEVVLYPTVTIKDPSQHQLALELHDKAHKMCFIANSCNFPVLHQPKCLIESSR